MMFTVIVGLYTTKQVLAILGVEDYGIYNVVGGFVGLLSFLNMALANATTRFLAYEIGNNQQENISKVYTACISIHFIIASFVVVLGSILGPWYISHFLVIPVDRVSAAIFVFFFSLAFSFFNITQVPYTALIISYERMKIYAYLAMFEAIFKLVVVIFLIVFPNYDSLRLYAVLMFGVQVIVLLFYRFYCSKAFPDVHFRLPVERSRFLPIVKFAALDVFGNLSAIIWFQGYSLVLNYYYGTIINAAYGVSKQISSVVHRFSDNFLTAVKPQITKSYAAKEYDYMLMLLEQTSKYSLLLVALFAIPLIIETEYILDLWLDEVPLYCVTLTRLCLFYLCVISLLVPVNICIHATGRMKEISFLTGAYYLLALPVLFIVLRYWDFPYLAEIMSIMLQTLALATNLLLFKKYIPLFSIRRYFKNAIFPALWVLALTSSAVLTVHAIMAYGLIRLIIVFLSSFSLYLYLVMFLILDKDTRVKIYQKLRIA